VRRYFEVMLERLLNRIRKVPFVAYRLKLRAANREQRTLDEEYRIREQEARKKNASAEELDALFFITAMTQT